MLLRWKEVMCPPLPSEPLLCSGLFYYKRQSCLLTVGELERGRSGGGAGVVAFADVWTSFAYCGISSCPVLIEGSTIYCSVYKVPAYCLALRFYPSVFFFGCPVSFLCEIFRQGGGKGL